MGTSKSQDIRNIAVVGHKGAGKTALIEAMLYLARVIPRLGGHGAGHRPSSLDDTPEERAHLGTFQTRLVSLPWAGKKLNILDTPGESGFFADTQLALAVADAALLVVSAKHGVETGTERVARLIREMEMPCLVVLTKVDDPTARTEEVLAQVRSLKQPVALMEIPHRSGEGFDGVVALDSRRAWVGAPETPAAHDPGEVPADVKDEVERLRSKLVDEVAGTDDTLTEHYLVDGDLAQGELDEGVHKAIANCKLVPVFCASSTTPRGISALLDGVAQLLPSPLERRAWSGTNGDGSRTSRGSSVQDSLAAAVFKTTIDPHAGRLSCVRVLAGTLHHDSHLWCQNRKARERAAQILTGAGKDLKPMPEAVAGDIVYVTKLKHAATGDTLSDEKHPFSLAFPERPFVVYSRAVMTKDKAEEDKVAQVLQRLCEEDVGLSFSHGSSRELVLSGLGTMHLDVSLERLKQRASVDLKLGPPRIPYRETISRAVTHVEGKQKKQTGGHGQFGVCYLDLEPLPRGSGYQFEDAVVGGSVPRQFIGSVEKGVLRALSLGVLAGYPMVDVKVRLVDGKHHSVGSSDAAFQAAGFRAFRAAAAAAHPILLEPVVKLEVIAPAHCIGDVIGDLSSRHGKVLGTDADGEQGTITAHLPLAQVLEYEPTLTALTQGRGRFTVAFDHHEPCAPQVQEKVVRESGFAVDAEAEG